MGGEGIDWAREIGGGVGRYRLGKRDWGGGGKEYLKVEKGWVAAGRQKTGTESEPNDNSGTLCKRFGSLYPHCRPE